MRRAAIIFLVCLAGLLASWMRSRLGADSLPPDAPLPAVGSAGGPSRALNSSEAAQWLRGRGVFDRDFDFAEGLGLPDLNGDSCRGCHQDPVIGGAGGLDVNVFRFAVDQNGVGPFQNLPGGQVASKIRAAPFPGRDEFDPAADVFEQRQTPTALGLGLIDVIFDSAILAGEDPLDLNSDGIRGVARQVPIQSGGQEIGRFGWKAQIPRLADFIHDAMAGELGITSTDNGRGFALTSDSDSIADPELRQEDFDDLLFYMQHLAAPPRGGSSDPGVQVGELLFSQIGCAICHVPSLDSPLGPVPLYSNLLLHNVMPTGFRGMEEPGAPAGFYRTPPLWGISKTAPYFHDGRAETLLDAILMHEGEASNVRLMFSGLSTGQQNAVLLFLEDL